MVENKWEVAKNKERGGFFFFHEMEMEANEYDSANNVKLVDAL